MKNSAKFVLTLALTVASAASCHKEIAVQGEGFAELTLNPQVDVLTKAPISGTAFPDNRTIVLSAYNNIPGGTSANFFQGITFKEEGSGKWTGGGGTNPKYWPVSGTLDLLAYSADGFTTAPTPTYATKCSESVTLVVPAENKTKQVDILFAGATGKSATGSALDMQFKHAEAVVAFDAKAQVPYNGTSNLGVTINSITLNGVKTSGSVTLRINETCTWSPGAAAEDVNLPGIPSGGYNVTGGYIYNIATKPFAIGNTGLIVIPQTATSFTVNYTVHYGKDSSSNPINKNETFTHNITSTNWEAGKEYVYQLDFKQDQILVNSEILDWDVTSGGATVPSRVSAKFKDSNATKISIDLCESGTAAKLSAGGIVCFDWGDGRYEIIENTNSTEMTLASIPHKYTAAPTDSVKIYVRRGMLDFDRTDIEHYFRVYNPSEVRVLDTYNDLSVSGTANCYIVSAAGRYKFKTFKGNSTTSVGTPNAVEVLWESFGNANAISEGDLIEKESVLLRDGYVRFEATDKKGNAVIAVKNGGTILWSWHIWLTNAPVNQTYCYGAGVVMDRNLGATSAAKGSVEALGLLYQWGRKDPFLGSKALTGSEKAISTLNTWPTTNAKQTPNDAVQIPTTYIINNINWADGSDLDNLWKSSKTMYDPCPPGYRVPDGGANGVWYKAFLSPDWDNSTNWDSLNKGMDFATTDKKLSFTASSVWYPAAGYRAPLDAKLDNVGSFGYYWSCTPEPSSSYSFLFEFSDDYYVRPYLWSARVDGQSVRCLKE